MNTNTSTLEEKQNRGFIKVTCSIEMMEEKVYTLLKDLKLEFEENNTRGFSVCFWLYLSTCTSFPSILLHHQVPFLPPFSF